MTTQTFHPNPEDGEPLSRTLAVVAEGAPQLFPSSDTVLSRAIELSDLLEVLNEPVTKPSLLYRNPEDGRVCCMEIGQSLRVGRLSKELADKMGQADGCDLALKKEMSISKRHFTVARNEEHFVIANLSDSGTQVNGQSVGSEARRLFAGDKITAGPVNFIFVGGDSLFEPEDEHQSD